MTTTSPPRIRSKWLSRTAAGLAAGAVAMGVLGFTAAPAQALAPGIISVSFGPASADVRTGEDPATFTVTMKNVDPRKAQGVAATVSAPGLENYVDLSVDGCDGVEGMNVNCGEIGGMASKTFTITVSGKLGTDLAEGATKSGKVTVSVTSPNTTSGEAAVNVIGTKQTATGISGTVTDLDHKPVKGVEVKATDSASGSFGPVTTGEDGTFNIGDEVALGEVTITYTKDGYEKGEKQTNAEAGQPVAADFQLEESAKDDKKSDPPKEDEADPKTPADRDTGLGATTWVLIILGVLLVAGGVTAIVMLIRKGKNDDDPDEDEDALPVIPSTYQPSAAQTGHLGVYDAASRRPGMDSPTMIHNGPLINDDDLARYGSEPAESTGFGPAYGESGGDSRPTQMVDPTERPSDMGSTSRYPAQEAGGWGQSSDAPVSGGWGQSSSSDAPTSGGWGAQQNAPVSGGWGQSSDAPTSGGWGSTPAIPPQSSGGDSGWGQSNTPTSGGWGTPRSEPASGSWGQSSDTPAAGGWGQSGEAPGSGGWGTPSSEPASGGWGQSAPSSGGWGSTSGEDSGQGGRHSGSGQDAWGGGYDAPPQQPRGRRYRDDDDEGDRPQSW